MAYLQCEIYSESIRSNTSLSVILPVDESRGAGCAAVLYLLHGRGQNAQSWMRYTRIESYAEKYNIAVIMPEAGISFYNNMRFGGAYFDYITKELPELSGRMFNIPKTRDRTYIAGLSMGGYGTLRCLFSRPELYAGGASFSAVTDIRWRLADTKEDTPSYRNLQAVFGEKPLPHDDEDLFVSALNFVKAEKRPRLYISCGTEDIRHEQNLRLSSLLSEKAYGHRFEDWEGGHTWDFWDISIQKALSFFFEE